MNVVTQLDEARQRQGDAVLKMKEWDDKIQSLPDTATDEELTSYRGLFDGAVAESKRWAEQVERLEAIDAANRQLGRREVDTPDGDDDNGSGTGTADPERRFARPRGSSREARTYSVHTPSVSFFGDLINAQANGNIQARQRLEQHMREYDVENRAISTTVTAGGNFVPPEYLGELYAQLPRAGRPFADNVPKMQFDSNPGMNITIPRITTGTSTSVIITENSTTVSSTDIVEALLTVPVRTIAGQQDVSQQLLDHSQPGIDQVIFGDLRADYDRTLDTQLLNGTGINGQHLGIRAVSSVNTVSFSTGGATAAQTVPPIYNAIQLIASNRFAPADTITMHPRRAAFLASNLSSTFPLFQQGGLYQAAGQQDQGMVNNFAGLNVLLDANVRTTDGGTTNQDEIYVTRTSDMYLWEGPLVARVMEQVLSNTLTVRLQLYAYSAFASGRQPKSITVISGLGLAAPTF
jgi:HK97 family phage major capsid protein